MFKVVSGALLLAATIGISVSADGLVTPERRTHLRFNTPIGLPGVTLPAGTYTFEIVSSASSLDIVRVMSRDRKQVYLTRFTRQVERPRNLRSDRQIVFAEVLPGQAPRIAEWYPLGDSIGHQFIYADARGN